MTLSDLEWPFHASRAITAVAEPLVRYGYVSRFRRYKDICVPSFDKMSQSTAEILLLLKENGRQLTTLKFYFQFLY